jgi:hypothetical protein
MVEFSFRPQPKVRPVDGSFPFRFRRQPEPTHATLTIAETADLTEAALEAVRAGDGGRLAVFGDGDAIAELADQVRDQLIDPARGNWDFFADHPSNYARSSAIEAFLPDDPDVCSGYTCASRYVLLRAIQHAGDEPGATLSAVRDLIRDLPPEAVAEAAGHDSGNGHALRWGMTVLAGVRRATHAFADHDRLMPRISIARWLAGSASTILFVRREPGLTSSEVVAVEASLRDHAMLSRMDVFPLALPSQSMEVVDGHR